ncbi:hypothetical protein VB711_06540 [Cronbergia sp. UHCC 0137]|uniref:hypothetical protein n=1 Tax=Cronbergia sp. UHCC 0137 TaxID=3110239 RepID=UPI002B1FC9E1|nr:hypothetical protein [Cronbergia sp. UHCC 0137]MEA5617495.1 hypothetical protein [Cronbergia sp. UHCC 0137]
MSIGNNTYWCNNVIVLNFVTFSLYFSIPAGADYLILDEGEITIPMFLEALEKGKEKGI